jgi:hypothetical protein
MQDHLLQRTAGPYIGSQDCQFPRQSPKSQQSEAKRALQKIWRAESKKDVLAFRAFVKNRVVKCGKVSECLVKDREALLAFYDFLSKANIMVSSREAAARRKGVFTREGATAREITLSVPVLCYAGLYGENAASRE